MYYACGCNLVFRAFMCASGLLIFAISSLLTWV
jgi:hypothetical protein